MLKNTVKVKIVERFTDNICFDGIMEIDNLRQLAPVLSLHEKVTIEKAEKILEEAKRELTPRTVSLMNPLNKTTIWIEREYPARATHFDISIVKNGEEKMVVLKYTLKKGSLISEEDDLSFDEIAFRKKNGEVVAVMEKECFLESLKEATAKVVEEIAGYEVARRFAKEMWEHIKTSIRR